MKPREILKYCRKLTEPYRVTRGKRFHLREVKPDDTLHLRDNDEGKSRAREALAFGVERLAEFQERLFAQDRWAVLLVFQAMDAAGKDGVIKHVMSGVNPQGCQVHSFKAPSSEDLDHDYLWCCLRCLPERGRIGIFNRSYYEEVLVVRVHPELLARQKLPPERISKRIWDERFEDIRHLERYLFRNGIVVVKFFLHVSRKEQKKRFLERLQVPEKHWKFSPDDVREREHWDDYMEAYEDMIRRTATEEAPWHVVPADNKWFTRVVVAAAVIQVMAGLDLGLPVVDKEQRKALEAARRALLRE